MYAVAALRRWKQAGLLTELRPAEAQRLLPRSAQSAPSPEVIHAYYLADGDTVEAQWRRQTDRFVEVPDGTPLELVCRAIGLAMPSLEPLRARPTPTALYVGAGAEVVTVSRLVQHARIPGRHLREGGHGPRDVIRGVNAILSARGDVRRFVELRAIAGRHAFVAVDAHQARTLHDWSATLHRDLAALRAFSGWGDASELRAAG
ncbi:MAG: hypothetical protein KF729_15670 [Sandaracinaceae bacterium]|nr:hypothetical protein [Sandaracinaceae bacterium]